MTRYSRSVIPGRSASEGGANEMDRLVFGTKGRDHANDEEDSMPPHEVDMLIERATGDRRQGSSRRKSDRSDFAPLPEERKRSSSGDSKRGPAILAGALIVVAVFGVVVWNAYRDGVRMDDTAAAPELADAGPFKRPADIGKPATSASEATVFDQVEAKPSVDPAPEVRSEPPPSVQAVAPSVEAPKPAVTKTAETKPAIVKPAETKTVAATPPAPKAAEPVATAPAVAADLVPAPAPLKTPAPVEGAAAPAAQPELAGGFKPVFAKDGRYVVQIGAPSTEAAANAEWDKRAKAAPELFSAAERLIQRADVNGKTVYRVRAGAFATGADADSFCNAFKAKGGQCYRAAK